MVELGYELVLPAAVAGELLRPATRASVRRSKLFTERDPDPQEEIEWLRARYPSLGRGELGVIALGRVLQAQSTRYMCVLDDRAARRVAEALGLTLTGTMGLLEILNQQGRIKREELERRQAALLARGFRYKPER